jgi:imidazolonepropionase-like amidohydrolase
LGFASKPTRTAPEDIKNAIRAGVASIEHAWLIDDEGIALAKEHGTYLDMDIYDEECIPDAAKESKTPADFLEHDRDLGEISSAPSSLEDTPTSSWFRAIRSKTFVCWKA